MRLEFYPDSSVIKTEIRTIIQWKIHLLADVLQLRVLFSKAFGLCRPRLASFLRLLFPEFVKCRHPQSSVNNFPSSS